MVVINTMTPISFSTAVMPNPLIIIVFTAAIYHFAGTIFESICRGVGIFSIGNIIPESNITGIINPIPEIIIAACCESVKVDIAKPSESDSMI